MIRHLFFERRNRRGFDIRRAICSVFSEYETPKIVQMHSLNFAVLLRVMQIIILLYSVLYLLIYKKGYQKHDTAIISSVTLKVKGMGYIRTSRNQTVVIDGADYVIPPSENNAMFIMTNFIRTDQKRSRCAESDLVKDAVCQNDRQCENKPLSPLKNGRWTGRCLLSSKVHNFNRTANMTEKSRGLCEYAGWCPPEDARSPPMLVEEILNFTIFIKNFIEFPVFGVKHQNMVDNLKVCVFDPQNNTNCPIFTLNYIINKAETDLDERKLMLRYGGVIRVKLDWDCNLDRSIKLCKAIYSFARLDVPFREKPFSVGFNFRYASHWKQRSVQHRSLTKAYGFRLIISVSGIAGKFDFITLTLNTGSLVGLFGLASFLCDICLLYLSKNSRIYRNQVFESVHLGTRHDSIFQPSSKIPIEDISDTHANCELHEKTKTSRNNRKSQKRATYVRPLTSINSNRFARPAVV